MAVSNHNFIPGEPVGYHQVSTTFSAEKWWHQHTQIFPVVHHQSFFRYRAQCRLFCKLEWRSSINNSIPDLDMTYWLLSTIDNFVQPWTTYFYEEYGLLDCHKTEGEIWWRPSHQPLPTNPTPTPMMTSSNGNIFRVTGPLWRRSTRHRWIPLAKVSDAELWCFLWSAPEQTIE